jgi:hypothetical protein
MRVFVFITDEIPPSAFAGLTAVELGPGDTYKSGPVRMVGKHYSTILVQVRIPDPEPI